MRTKRKKSGIKLAGQRSSIRSVSKNCQNNHIATADRCRNGRFQVYAVFALTVAIFSSMSLYIALESHVGNPYVQTMSITPLLMLGLIPVFFVSAIFLWESIE